MSKKTKLVGAVLAITAASMFALTPVAALAMGKNKVHCYGVNSCKGKGKCKSADNACKKKNACKAKGMIPMSKDKCEKKGGTVMPESKATDTTK